MKRDNLSWLVCIVGVAVIVIALLLCLGEAKRNMERHSVVTAQEEAI